jgi:DNA-binding transcriptional LysR family regulator
MNQFEDMQTFITIVNAGSITKAAEQLDTVKSAISRRLSDLEKRLGVSLLTRTTRNQTLTDSGRSYYEQCLRIIDYVNEVESMIKDEHCAIEGRVKIAAPLSFGLTHLSGALNEFTQIHPGIIFDLDFNGRQVDLVQEGFDLAIRIANLEDSSLVARRLFTFRLHMCASPSYLAKTGIPTEPDNLLNGHTALNYSGRRDSIYTFLGRHGDVISIDIPSNTTANTGEYLCQAAIEGKGLFLCPDFICYKAVKEGVLVTILDDYVISDISTGYAVYPQTRHLSQRVRKLVDFLADYFGDKPYWSIPSK